MKIVFVSCVSKKLSKPARAEDLYTSPLFKLSLAYARSLSPGAIYVLSAKYGLVSLDDGLSPYEETLNAMKTTEVKAWSERVKEHMKGKVDFSTDEAVFLAGERYRKHLMPLFRHSSAPLKGLGIGKQLQFLKRYGAN